MPIIDKIDQEKAEARRALSDPTFQEMIRVLDDKDLIVQAVGQRFREISEHLMVENVVYGPNGPPTILVLWAHTSADKNKGEIAQF